VPRYWSQKLGEQSTSGTNMHTLTRKLKNVKWQLKEWAKHHIGNLYDKLSRNAQKLEYVEERLVANPYRYRFNSWLNRLLKQWEKLLLFNRKYWGKLAQKEWLVNGDWNSRFFQQSANSRRKTKIVMKIKDECGVWIDDHQLITNKFIIDYNH